MLNLNYYVYGAIAALVVVLGAGWYHTSGELTKSRVALGKQASSYALAQEKAKSLALTEKQRIENKYAVKAQEADYKYVDLSNQYADVLVRYKTAQRQASRPTTPSLRVSPESGDGPSGSPQLPEDQISIPYRDAEVCAVNTARLQAVQEWASKLNK